MGRLNQGFHAALLGEHVALEAQRALRRLRREAGVKTQLIVASIREWQTFVRVAGCDVFTAPCDVLGEFLAQTDVSSEALTSQLETSYEDRLGIADDAIRAVGQERIARLWRVEPEFVEFPHRLPNERGVPRSSETATGSGAGSKARASATSSTRPMSASGRSSGRASSRTSARRSASASRSTLT